MHTPLRVIEAALRTHRLAVGGRGCSAFGCFVLGFELRLVLLNDVHQGALLSKGCKLCCGAIVCTAPAVVRMEGCLLSAPPHACRGAIAAPAAGL